MRRYLDALQQRDFGLLFVGATASILGDGMTLVALLWMIWERTGSALALGWLTFWYTAPVVVGGLGAGVLLDRFDPRRVLLLDSLGRGVVMASVPALFLLDALPIWYLFVVAAIYGLLKMIPLAGVPTMIPGLVAADHLTTANALESIAYGVGGIIGPAAAGILIAVMGAERVIGIDAATYFVFAACLALMRGSATVTHSDGRVDPASPPSPGGAGLGQAVRLVVGAPALLATTFMFMAANVGEGALMVVLPVYADETLRAGAQAYGWLLAALSAGLLVGAVAVGAVPTPRRLGRAISVAQAVSGAALIGFVATLSLGPALGLCLTLGIASSPLTIWAQTLRMQLIPAALRGRVFALLRTMMQATPPLGGILAGVLLEGSGMPATLIVAALITLLPGLLGLVLPALAGRYPLPAAEVS